MKRDKNKYTKIVPSVIIILLCLSVCFIVLVFMTDSVVNVGRDITNSVFDFDRMSVSSTIELVEQPEPNPGAVGSGGSGGGTGPGGGPGPGGGVMPGIPTPNPNITLTPVTGTKITFPAIGELVDYVEINNKSNRGSLPRNSTDTVTWEFAYGYISKTNNPDFQIMRGRAGKISSLIVPTVGDENNALMVEVNGQRCYVGCSPIETFGQLGDIIRFTFSDGTHIDVLEIDAKAADDAEGKGFANQVNTNYCHGVLEGSGLNLSAIELWANTNATKGSVLPNSVQGKNVVSAEVIAHTNVFS